MKKELLSKFKEVITAVLPVSGIIMLLHFTIAPMPKGILALFLVSVVLLVLGMTLFMLGADVGMTPMGNQMGASLSEKHNLTLLIVTALLLGVAITIAEPDLQVLSKQMPNVTLFNIGGSEVTIGSVLILSVALGVGLFLVLSMLRVVFRWSLSRMLIILYIAVFVLALFTGKDFLAVAFDSGGVTTGPITVPFILALGVGVASVRGGRSSQDDSFGLVALCSVGPILTVLILGILAGSGGTYAPAVTSEITDAASVLRAFTTAAPEYAKEVALALSPIIVFYSAFQVFVLKLHFRALIKIIVGVVYTYVGLVIFLTAVNVGFMPTGSYIGGALGALPYRWVLVPVGMLVGFFIVAAEPAVHVLTEQVEEVTGGSISRKLMMSALAVGMCASVGLAMVRVLTGLSIWWMLAPGYAAALGLTFVSPEIFTAIAFDSGGVASGPMTATFLLPFAIGACQAMGGNVMVDAFGVVAMVAMTPLITIQILGTVYAVKEKRAAALEAAAAPISEQEEEDIIDF